MSAGKGLFGLILAVAGIISSNWLLQQTIPSGSSSSSSAPNMGFYFTPSCAAGQLNCTSTPADTLQFQDCGWTNASTTVTCTGAHFTAADVGKNVMGFQSCEGDLPLSAMSAGAISTTAAVTITGFISSTSVTLSATPANTATIGGGTNSVGGCFIYGHLDDAAASTIDTALQASPVCPKLFLAAANYFFSSPHFFTQPTACSNMTSLAGGPNTGSVSLPVGFEIEGRGSGPTAIFLNTNFPNGNACTNKPGPSSPVSGCFAIPVLGKWTGFRIDGGSQATTPNLVNKSLIAAAVATIDNFTCLNMGAFGNGLTGVSMDLLVQLYTLNNAGCGNMGLSSATNTGGDVGYRVVVENSVTNALVNNGEFWCYWCDFSLPNSGITAAQVVLNTGTLHLFGGVASPGNANTGATTNTGVTGYRCTNAAGTLFADNFTWAFNAGGGAATNGDIWNSIAGCKATLVSNTLQTQANGFAYVDGVNATLTIDPGTTYTGPFSNQAIVGSIIADGHALLGTCTGVATASATLGLYGTGGNTTPTVTTCTNTNLGSGVPMAQARTLRLLTCNSSATTVSVACTILVNGAASAMTCTMTAATSCLDFTHTVAVNKGDLISERIVTGAAETGANVQVFVMW